MCNSLTGTVQHENQHKSLVRFTVRSVQVEAADRKPSMDDLSPAWKVQPDFVKLDYPWIRNSSENMTPPLIPHIIHQVCHRSYRSDKCCVSYILFH